MDLGERKGKKKKNQQEFCLQQVKSEMPFKYPCGNGNRQQDADVRSPWMRSELK